MSPRPGWSSIQNSRMSVPRARKAPPYGLHAATARKGSTARPLVNARSARWTRSTVVYATLSAPRCGYGASLAAMALTRAVSTCTQQTCRSYQVRTAKILCWTWTISRAARHLCKVCTRRLRPLRARHSGYSQRNKRSSMQRPSADLKAGCRVGPSAQIRWPWRRLRAGSSCCRSVLAAAGISVCSRCHSQSSRLLHMNMPDPILSLAERMTNSTCSIVAYQPSFNCFHPTVCCFRLHRSAAARFSRYRPSIGLAVL